MLGRHILGKNSFYFSYAHKKEDVDFYLGNHFSPSEKDELESRNQSSVPLDRLYSAIEQFKAIITSKPPKFSAIPREDSDSKLANIWKVILKLIAIIIATDYH